MITLEQARTAAQAVAEREPMQVNPRNAFGTCVYTLPGDPDRHCFVGQVLLELGLPLPEVNAGISSTINDSLGLELDRDAIDFLAKCQSFADDNSEPNVPHRWHEVWEFVR